MNKGMITGFGFVVCMAIGTVIGGVLMSSQSMLLARNISDTQTEVLELQKVLDSHFKRFEQVAKNQLSIANNAKWAAGEILDCRKDIENIHKLLKAMHPRRITLKNKAKRPAPRKRKK